MTTNRMRPIHPGEILREEFLVPLQMTAHALSQAGTVVEPLVRQDGSKGHLAVAERFSVDGGSAPR